MHRSAALGVVKAATRLKILARQARERADEDGADGAAGIFTDYENGFRDSEGELLPTACSG